MEFKHLRDAVSTQLAYMFKGQMFKVAFPLGPKGELLDQLYNLYLDSFPEGTNPIFRKQREYDCSCCKSFIRAVGGMVSYVDGKLVSVWDVKTPKEPGFQPVVDAMAAYIRTLPIDNVYTHFQRPVGQERSVEGFLNESGKQDVRTWNHFSATLPPAVVKTKDEVGPYLADARSTFDVFKRALDELQISAISTVLDLVSDKAIYKHEEIRPVAEFWFKQKQAYSAIATPEGRHLYAWTWGMTVPQALSRSGNTSIGELLYALSEGKDIEDAVKAYEAMVAPSNYKRSKALITPKMIEAAKASLAELGLVSALERRFATLEDITAANILHSNRSIRPNLAGADVFDDLMASTASKVRVSDKIEEVSIDTFIKDILPRTEALEVLFENRLASNMVSLIAPVDPTAGKLLKWDNGFTWSYTGDVTDSIKERVKAAGGVIDAEVCVRLAWNYEDDLDLHLTEPKGYEISFGNRRQLSPLGGMLDVDANGIDGIRTDPSENIFYKTKAKMAPGMYNVWVHNFTVRNPAAQGFAAQMEFDGQTIDFTYDKRLGRGEVVPVVQFEVLADKSIRIVKSLPNTQTSKMVWGLPTQTLHKVKVLMASPNHWDGQTGHGHKHYFFMLDKCKNDGKARGFYNEFLREDLNAHRKVFEVVGAKMRFDGKEADEQLSGLGFSSTRKDSVTVKVFGATTRMLKINFNV